ncbi:hypothetical protein [Fimbriimonas ginsengisoli]|uniref:Uncharacterized protein n=1 Tax=Fimbriimonas ginsengisoli Gsoil 348 TaxID=661478 RepID=A0A068NYN0_FIMGI|nr:hypothetical protein [Fimbriimonas ginsengisoli]AIE87109.1 hypothetical protein OP10G_3741 [Fimbriimonas ginsengisoli Gsoil 348]
MLALLLVAVGALEDTPRTPSIYRCPAAEAESKFFEPLIDSDGFDTYCVEPKPGPRATAAAKGKVKFISAKLIDTPANLRWRNAAIDFVNGKISPREWLSKTKGLHETIHFLSNPKTADLRSATGAVTRRAVQAEMLVLSWPGKPCFTADDIVQTRYFPGPGAYESWILAMNDYLGPMLYGRSQNSSLVTGNPKIVRADPAPGLLIFTLPDGKKTQTFYFNNSKDPIALPPIKLELLTINVGLNLEGAKPFLNSGGFAIVGS